MVNTYRKKKQVISCAQLAIALLLCCIFVLGPTAAICEPVTGQEYEVKLGFIYNFVNFISWPESTFKNDSDVMTFCFASDNPASSVLFKLDGKSIKGRKIKVVAYEQQLCLEQSQILFFATQDKEFIKKVLNLTKGRSILTVGEVDGFAAMGGTINFFKDSNQLRFQINVDAVQRSALKMSSQLLSSAKIIKEKPE